MRRPDRLEPPEVTFFAANDNAWERPRPRTKDVKEAVVLIAGILVSGAFYLAIGYGVWRYFAS